MHSKLRSSIYLLGLLMALALKSEAQPAAPAAPQAAGTQVAGRITAARVTGLVTLINNATKVTVPVTANQFLAQGSTVSTGNASSVVLVFSNGATINLGANSDLNIETFMQDPFTASINNVNEMKEEPTISTTKITLNRGELVGKVAHLKTDQGSSFTVATPVGAAGIRGTTFQIVYRPSGDGRTFNFTLTTADGTVVFGTVNAPANAAPVAVSNNQQVNITGDVNAQTGTVTIAPPPAGSPPGTTVAVVDAPNLTITQVLAQAQVIAQAVAPVVIAPVTNSSGGGTNNSGSNGSGNGNGNGTDNTTNASSGATKSQSSTTPGAGQ
jgi:hypothetical protein